MRCLSLIFVAFFLFSCGASQTDLNDDAILQKRIALSYDDAPKGKGPVMSGGERTAALINQLKAANTGPVIFFVTTKGLNSPEGRERIEAYANAGHIIANHSDTHQWASRASVAEYTADIDRAEVKLAELSNRRPWFRFPYLDEGGRGGTEEAIARRDQLRSALTERGLKNGYVTVDTFDWYLDDLWRQTLKANKNVDIEALSKVYVDMVVEAAEHYDALALEVLGRRPAQVLLLHENDLSGSFTQAMVDALRKNGWTIIDPDEAYSDPIANIIPVTTSSGSGRIAEIAVDAGLTEAQIFGHWSISRKGIDQRVAKAGVFRLSTY